MDLSVIKESGEKEAYSKDKFCSSLKEAGAPEGMVQNVCTLLEKDLTSDVTTSEIFRRASKYLQEQNIYVAARYNLKRGIQNLGPAGFHFEHLVEVMLQTLGFQTKRNQILNGECVSHEVDVLGEKDGTTYILEAKYHNQYGVKTHIDDVMYAEGRMEDICRRNPERQFRVWLVTNTKFTEKAIDYAKCRNLILTGWNHPKGESLEETISKHHLYPITVFPSVERYELEQFAKENIMLARDLAPYPPHDLVEKFLIDPGKAEKIIKEVHALVYGEEKTPLESDALPS
jgi:hypothetical protein